MHELGNFSLMSIFVEPISLRWVVRSSGITDGGRRPEATS